MSGAPLVIGIAGGSGSGKTTVARAVLGRAGEQHIVYVPHDAYYRNFTDFHPTRREDINWDHPDALETDLMVEHVGALKAGRAVELPVYDFAEHRRTDRTLHLEPQPIIVVEGILIFVDARLRDLFDVKIFVDTDADLRFIRRFERDVAERGRTPQTIIHQYLSTVRPMHLEFVEPSKRYADVIIPHGGYNDAAMEMISAHIRSLLGHEQSAETQPEL